MLRVICKHDRAMRTLVKQLRFNNPVFYRPQDSAAVKIMAVVIGVFLLCCGFRLECGFRFVLLNSQDNCADYFFLEVLTVVLNSVVNPIAYALFKRDIKNEIKRLISKHSAKTFPSN